jgi:hypothetical protein
MDLASTTEITYSGTASVVPEPSTIVLLLLGLGGLAARARRSPGRTRVMVPFALLSLLTAGDVPALAASDV